MSVDHPAVSMDALPEHVLWPQQGREQHMPYVLHSAALPMLFLPAAAALRVQQQKHPR